MRSGEKMRRTTVYSSSLFSVSLWREDEEREREKKGAKKREE